MLFNSPLFIYLFLPSALAMYVAAHRWMGVRAAQWALLIASSVFYGAWSWKYLLLLYLALSVNYLIGGVLLRRPSGWILAAGVSCNLALLGYFKYANFFVSSLNEVIGTQYALLNIILPLGMSFFIFQKIAYLTDCHRGLVVDRDPLRFAIFVMFFPQLIAGPIVHHAEITSQLKRQSLLPDDKMLSMGLFLFASGLFKKVIVADWLAEYVNLPFAHAAELQFLGAWTAAIAYSMQLYFDFSGYSEMAMGLACFFGVLLPINFNSPYKAANIAEFWRRWHITLGRFLRDYLYIPLGGSHHGKKRAAGAALVVMTLGGLWHGAGWTFVLWGLLHGVFLAIHRLWNSKFSLGRPVGMVVTFLAVTFAWVLFRAASLSDALALWKTMLGFKGFVMPPILYSGWPAPFTVQFSPFINGIEFWFLLVLVAFVMLTKNVHEMLEEARTWKTAALISVMTITSIFALSHPTTFLYYQF